jgi:hypothetical protein
MVKVIEDTLLCHAADELLKGCGEADTRDGLE